MDLPVLEDLPDPSGRRVLVRTDFNVPIHDGVITDDLRVRLPIETISWLLDHGAAHVTVASHLGRPKGAPDARSDLAAVRTRMYDLLDAAGADRARVTLLDNLRWDAGEEADDAAFVGRLVDGQDLYVDDAFGAAHRAHASIVGPPRTLPSAAGRVLAREVGVISGLLASPPAPSSPSSAARR